MKDTFRGRLPLTGCKGGCFVAGRFEETVFYESSPRGVGLDVDALLSSCCFILPRLERLTVDAESIFRLAIPVVKGSAPLFGVMLNDTWDVDPRPQERA